LNFGTGTGLLLLSTLVMNTFGNWLDKHFSTREDTVLNLPARYPCSLIDTTNGFKKYKKRK
jgi:hypothetical protein